MEQEKDNFWVWIGALIVAVVIGVFMLKSREMESAAFSDSYKESQSQVEKQISKNK